MQQKPTRSLIHLRNSHKSKMMMSTPYKPLTRVLLLGPFCLTLLAGCQNNDKGTTVATYSSSIERAYESVSLTSDQKYQQKLTYHIRGTVGEVLLGGPIDLPITLYARGTWRLLDAKTGAVMDISRLSQAYIENADVELKGAVGPAPLQETSVRYTFIDRSIPAIKFKRTSQNAASRKNTLTSSAE